MFKIIDYLFFIFLLVIIALCISFLGEKQKAMDIDIEILKDKIDYINQKL